MFQKVDLIEMFHLLNTKGGDSGQYGGGDREERRWRLLFACAGGGHGGAAAKSGEDRAEMLRWSKSGETRAVLTLVGGRFSDCRPPPPA